jgi:hypothetical protein
MIYSNIQVSQKGLFQKIENAFIDEIGVLVQSFSNYLDFIEKGLIQDKIVIDESYNSLDY